MQRDERHRQLLQVSWKLIGEEGTDALSLGRLAEQAGVTKPVVYDHFGTRDGLLAALYQDFDARQTMVMDAALETSERTLDATAAAIASCYVECVLVQGREIPGVLAALAGSPEMEKIKRDYQLAFIEKCRAILAPFTGARGITTAGFWAMLGAAEALSHAAAIDDVTSSQACEELHEFIVAMVHKSRQPKSALGDTAPSKGGALSS